MGMGQTPFINRSAQNDGPSIIRDPRTHFSIIDISIPAGFGVIPSGQVMGVITESTNRAGRYVPRVPQQPSAGLTNAVGITYVTATPSGTTCFVTMEDSYKFAVGDHIAIADYATYNASAEDLGAITAIDRTTYTHIAQITFTNSVSGSFTTANGACIWIQTLTTAEYFQAKGILLGAVDTGVGENAKGGDGALIVGGGGLVYKNKLKQYDSVALADFSGSSEVGQYLKFV